MSVLQEGEIFGNYMALLLTLTLITGALCVCTTPGGPDENSCVVSQLWPGPVTLLPNCLIYLFGQFGLDGWPEWTAQICFNKSKSRK